MKAHCLFEQSGTFKNEFKKLGIEAYDYDILNDYGQTDFQIDLFAEIENAYRGGEKSVFDSFSEDDIVLAFFPCTRFEDQILLSFRGDAFQMKNYTDKQKLETDLRLHEELHRNYSVITMLALTAINKRLRLVIENPIAEQHYLKRYWCLKPAIIDKDRSQNGDYYKKPTQFFFIGCKPKNNLVFEPIDFVERKKQRYVTSTGGKSREMIRSEIHPQYASRFIRQYILDESEVNNG